MSRLDELATVFEAASKRETNIVDQPFGCVPLNLTPSTCAEIAGLFRSWQVLLDAVNSRRGNIPNGQ